MYLYNYGQHYPCFRKDVSMCTPRDLMVLCNLRKNMKIPPRRKFKERRFLRVLLRGQYHLGRMVSKVRSHMHPLFP